MSTTPAWHRMSHDAYGKTLLVDACRSVGLVPRTGAILDVPYPGERGHIDGYVEPGVAVEIESRTGKQIRGAVVDLVHHVAPSKLLIILPMYNAAGRTAESCTWIMSRHLPVDRFRVVVTRGHGGTPHEGDVALVANALQELVASFPANTGEAATLG